MKWMWSLACILCTAFSAQAAPMDVTAFGGLPLQHEGRIKPIASFARLEYRHLTGQAFVDTQKAEAFLAQALFDPTEAANQPLISIRNPHTLKMLGLPAKERRFSFMQVIGPVMRHEQELTGWLQQDEKTLGADQKDMVDLYDKLVGLTQIMRSFTAVLPLANQLPPNFIARYHLPPDHLSYLDFSDVEEPIRRDLHKIVQRKGQKIAHYSRDEQGLAYVAYQLDEIRKGGAENTLLRILPAGWDATWYSPWEMLLSGQGSPQAMQDLRLWQKIAQAYRDGKAADFAASVQQLNTRMISRPDVSEWRLHLEQFYYASSPALLALGLYFAALILLCARRPEWGVPVLTTGFFVHAATILLRVLILARPPVSTLFESILFVGFVAVGGALACERIFKNGTGALLAAILGFLLQFVALGFAQNGDTLEMLQAVLNTPFWLATHVLMITAGYGACLLTALLAHGALFLRGKSAFFAKPIAFAALTALLLTAVGTLLGGLWADQSWGRFWGWDPKENGALLIVLWLTWLLHGKLSGHIKEISYHAGLAALTIVVALAWFGVNLLSTGLHSYGFTSGIATALFGYVTVQGVLIGFLGWRAAKREA